MFFVHPQIKLNNFKKINLAQKLESYFPSKQLIFTDMGRSAFKIIIGKLNLQNSEIMMPAYICDIFQPILEKYNIKPIFLDIDLKTFHIKREEIFRKITPRTKAILVCHTYGLPFDVDGLRSDLPSYLSGGRTSDIAIIEDCAHAFGVKPKSDIAFFSLYKQFPALRGGLLVCPKDWQISLPKTNFNFRDFISLLNCLPFFAFIFKKFGNDIAPKMLRKEKLPEPAGLNKLSLALFYYSLEDFEKSMQNRIKLAKFFQQELQNLGFEVQEHENNVFCYLSALVPKNLENKRDEIVAGLRRYRVFCTRIWHTPIVLSREEFPNTFEVAKRIINFPLQNYYAEKDIRTMLESIKNVLCEF
ncbi:MAG: DegT/DnrJ/EryC1/StrS aminotransferase family protein [Candidatus Nealsonbacteria bacterium]|nr:DegT/DnrJ/EryC1/StrS aminotransferase family protein [Candidatus Nealsonbacteria bacterium]